MNHFPVTCHPRRWFFAALLCASLLAGCSTPATRPPECRLPARTHDSSPHFALSSKTHYLQRDPRWAAEPIGGSGRPLGNVGCALCCLSMALSQYGIELTPAELNRELKQIDAFTSSGWVFWPAIESVTDGRARVEILHDPSHRDIEDALAIGQPVIVKVAPPNMIQHWVLLVGREGREFLMKDPLDEKKTLLSSLGSKILAVRVVKSGR
jgi:hypothetical protein